MIQMNKTVKNDEVTKLLEEVNSLLKVYYALGITPSEYVKN